MCTTSLISKAGACPSAFVASTEFVQAAEAQATSLGFPTVARVFVPHPIQDRTDDEMRAYADGVRGDPGRSHRGPDAITDPPVGRPQEAPTIAPTIARVRKLVAMVLAAALTGAAGGSIGAGRAEAGTTGLGVTLVGDSVMAAFNYVPSAQTTISSGYAMNLDAKVCRRLVAPSCSYQGVAPPTARQVIQANATHLGDVVVVNVGYNDSWTTYRAQMDQIMQAIAGHGVPFVLWVTLRQSGPNAGGYANINAAIRSAAATYPQLRIADWNAYSAGQSSGSPAPTGSTSRPPARWRWPRSSAARLDALLPCQPKLAMARRRLPSPPSRPRRRLRGSAWCRSLRNASSTRVPAFPTTASPRASARAACSRSPSRDGHPCPPTRSAPS